MSESGISAHPPGTGTSDASRGLLATKVLRFAGFQRCVSDLQRSVAFYCDGLGFLRDNAADTSPAVEHAMRSARLLLGDEWIQLRECPRAALTAAAPVSSAAFQHIAVVTPDIHAAIAQLRRCSPFGISTGGPVQLPANAGGVTAWKFRDPDGHPVELIEFPDGIGDPKWKRLSPQSLTLGIDHSAISVVDVELSLAFYCGRLGLSRTARQVNRGVEQARLDGVPESIVEVVGLAPAHDATPHVELLGYRTPAPQRTESVAADGADCMVFVVARIDDIGRRLDPPGTDSPATLDDGSEVLPRYVRLRDPDGHLFELMEAPETTACR